MKVEYNDNQLTYKMPSATRGWLLGMIVLGVISLLISFLVLNKPPADLSRSGHSNLGWSVLLVSLFLPFGVASCGIFFTAISHITGSHWSITVRAKGYRATVTAYDFFILLVTRKIVL